MFSIKIISDYIDGQYERYFQEEIKKERSLKEFNDTRVHICLYFILPVGRIDYGYVGHLEILLFLIFFSCHSVVLFQFEIVGSFGFKGIV